MIKKAQPNVAKLAAAIVVVCLTASQPVAAQSDGSLERLYQSQCAGKEPTQACRALSAAMSQAGQQSSEGRPVDPAGAAQAEQTSKWGVWGKMAGKTYARLWKPQNGFGKNDWVYRYEWQNTGQTMVITVWEAFKWDRGGKPWQVLIRSWDGSSRQIVDHQGRPASFVDADGSIVSAVSKKARLVTRSTGRGFEMRGEGLKGDEWRVGWVHPFVEITPEVLAEFRAGQQSSGNGGLFGALAMAAGAALAGGNTDMLMGAAMRGAQLTAGNAGTRAAVAGQGDAMLQSGLDRSAAGQPARNPPPSAPRETAAEQQARYRAAFAQVPSGAARQPGSIGGSVSNLPPLVFYWQVSLQNQNGDTRNQICASNNIVGAPFDWNAVGANGRADQIANQYRASFLQKCSRLRPLVGEAPMVNFKRAHHGSEFGGSNATHRVTLP